MRRRVTHAASWLPLTAIRWCSLAAGAALPTVGDPSCAHLTTRTSESSRTTISDIIGLSTVGTEIVHRLPAGEVLGMMDICAARTAAKHVTGSPTGQGRLQWGRSSIGVATIAAGNTTFKFPLLHGDSVEVTGTVVNVGKSSLAVHIETNRLEFPTRRKQLVSESTFFMVVIESASAAVILPKSGMVPPLQLSDESHLRWHKESVCARKWQTTMAKEYERLKTIQLNPDELTDTSLATKKERLVTFESTKTHANRLFFPGHLNLNKTIFGGEIIRWMEMHAVHCGRLFTANKSVFTIGMHSVEFRHPIMLSDWVSLEASVVYVHNTTIEVDVEVFIERQDCPVVSNKASFILTNFDEVGIRKAISVGLDLSNASPEWLWKYACARYRYQCRHPRGPDGSSAPFLPDCC